mgnify:FL=1
MKSNNIQTDSTSQAFLTGTIFFANLDASDLQAYAIKAVIGGAIWMVFKLAGDYFSDKILSKKNGGGTTTKKAGDATDSQQDINLTDKEN